MRALLAWLGRGVAAIVYALLYVAALAFSPFRLGRLLKTVSLPRLRAHLTRTSMSALGVALGVAMLLAVVVVNRSILRGVTSTVEQFAGRADLQVGSGSIGFDEDLVDAIKGVPGVARVAPVLQQSVVVPLDGARNERLMVIGIDLLSDDDAYFHSYESETLGEIRRDPLTFLNGSTNLLLGRSFAARLGYNVHDKIPIATATGRQLFEISGLLEDTGIAHALGGAVAVMYYPAMQVRFARAHNIDRVEIAVAKQADTEAVASALRARLGPTFTIERPARKSERVAEMLQAVTAALTLATAIAMMVGAFLIYNTISISVVQRKRELGILRALGTTRGELSRLLTLEGVLLGSVGSLLGLGVGALMARAMLAGTNRAVSNLYMQLSSTEVQLDAAVLLLAWLAGVVGSGLAATLAARAAGGISPAESMRKAALIEVARSRGGWTVADTSVVLLLLGSSLALRLDPIRGVPAGAMLSALGLLLAAALALPRCLLAMQAAWQFTAGRVFGLSGRFANANLARDLGRSSVTAGALMVSIAMATSFSGFTDSFITSLNEWSAQAVPGDLFVTSGASVSGLSSKNVPMAPELGDQLQRLPGVHALRRLRVAEIEYRGTPIKLVSTDILAYQKFCRVQLIEGDRNVFFKRLEQGAIAISDNFARRFGVHGGERLELTTRDGTRSFPVAGVIVDYTSHLGTIMMSRSTYIAAWGDERVDTFELHVNSPSDIERVRSAINGSLAQAHDLFVLTNAEFRGEFVKAVDGVFGLLRTLELIALVVAVLGMVNSQLANVLDRTREIGVLRAVGMLRRRVREMVMFETVLLGLYGLAAGLCVGLVLGYILLKYLNVSQTGWLFPYRVSCASLAKIAAITLPFSLLAGWLPARNASRLLIVQALEQE